MDAARAARTKVLAPLFVLTAFFVRYAVLYLVIYTATQCDFGRSKGFVYYFVRSACGFGADVFDDYFAVFCAFQQGIDVAFGFFLCWFAVFMRSHVSEKAVQLGVKSFGGVYSAFSGVLYLRKIFEGVGVYHVGGFNVDVPRFFFEAPAYFDEGAYGVEQVEIALELFGVEPVGIVLGKFGRYAERGFDEAEAFQPYVVVPLAVCYPATPDSLGVLPLAILHE
ncbi:MAG: hypothetical protein LBB81_00670 [Treponema sp.]|nr:hypothetical protein [Treponema sp.]